ncbi:MAG TPA: OmpA family protein [Salinisphaeraceae bacterium]|nr:OmpA family protein [Salinisphaeraceae bacterium]
MNRILLVALACSAMLIGGCAGTDYRRTEAGTAIGAVLGGLAGSQLGDESSTNVLIGAAVGALAGGAVGRYMDNQEHELQARLKAEREANILHITRLGDGSLKIGIASDASFAIDSATLSQQAQQTFNKIASVLRDYDKTIIHIVGHTDSTGSAEHNMRLSLERAQSVANFMAGRGINSQRMLTWGRGESQPIATNDTPQGRTRNRRVDIVIKPIVEGQEAQALSEPAYLGR